MLLKKPQNKVNCPGSWSIGHVYYGCLKNEKSGAP